MTQSAIFQAVPRSATLTSRLIKQIEGMMAEHCLQPGHRLPPERDLSQQFGVSRTVIREAVAALVAKGLLEMAPGGGTVVRVPSAVTVSNSLSLYLQVGQENFSYDKINEVRRMLEVEIAGFAAERRTSADIASMASIIEESKRNTADRASFAQHDVAFHAALARSTQNELFSLLLGSLADVLLKVRERGFDVPGTPQRALNYHQAILDAVRASDAPRARYAMQKHLLEAEETQRQAANQLAEKIS